MGRPLQQVGECGDTLNWDVWYPWKLFLLPQGTRELMISVRGLEWTVSEKKDAKLQKPTKSGSVCPSSPPLPTLLQNLPAILPTHEFQQMSLSPRPSAKLISHRSGILWGAQGTYLDRNKWMLRDQTRTFCWSIVRYKNTFKVTYHPFRWKYWQRLLGNERMLCYTTVTLNISQMGSHSHAQ